MTQNAMRAGPLQGPARHDHHVQRPAKSTDPRSPATISRNAADAYDLPSPREVDGYAAAAEYLNARRLAAAVPAYMVPLLRVRGLAVWPAGAADDLAGEYQVPNTTSAAASQLPARYVAAMVTRCVAPSVPRCLPSAVRRAA